MDQFGASVRRPHLGSAEPLAGAAGAPGGQGRRGAASCAEGAGEGDRRSTVDRKSRGGRPLGPASCQLLPFPFFGWEGSPTKVDYRKKSGYQLILTSLLEDLGGGRSC